MSLRRMLPFILINVVVSTVVVLLLLYWWDSRAPNEPVVATTEQLGPLDTPAALDFTTSATSTEAPDGQEGDVEEADGEAEEGPTTHIVQAGETLGIISQRYDVPIDDIAAANDIANVNAISVGQELIIPIGGLPTQTPQPTAVPTETPTVTPTPTSAVEEASPLIEITEVIGIGDLTKEAVRISNGGARPLMLRGWRMEDEDGNVYTFVDVTLYGSGDAGAPSILIHTEAGQNGPSDLYWGQEAAVWESGETVTVRDASGALQASYEIQ